MSRFIRLAGSLALIGTAPVSGLAQEPVRGVEPAVEPFELRLERGPDRAIQFVMNRRARLGLKVNLRARSTDSIGAYVDAVTPNGPAAQAGIQSGDIITKVDGKSVLAGGRAEAPRERESLPGLRLIELAAKLEPNDTVAVEFRRGKERKTVSVVTADEPDILLRGDPEGRSFAWRLGPNDPGGRAVILPFDEEIEGRIAPAFLARSPLADLELAPLNPDLGRYFGATEGILVISSPGSAELGLKGGDVVLAVDGRKPASPSHLLRILRSYEQGESFKLDILRNGKRESVTGRVGERAEG
ncbi:MAG TPA: PDZ domain-containing protein [Gemmatimonadales bacterium]|nr:PDZ domain-containing protein [Gemmatimonadales bacterium]